MPVRTASFCRGLMWKLVALIWPFYSGTHLPYQEGEYFWVTPSKLPFISHSSAQDDTVSPRAAPGKKNKFYVCFSQWYLNISRFPGRKHGEKHSQGSKQLWKDGERRREPGKGRTEHEKQGRRKPNSHSKRYLLNIFKLNVLSSKHGVWCKIIFIHHHDLF